ncbi:MAG: hypothetical protein ACUVR4_14005 [Anaerolineae bacterium]
MPRGVIEEALAWLETLPDEMIFKVEHEVGFPHQQMQLSYAKTRCARCGEYVMDDFVCNVGGQLMCIPCSVEQNSNG